jgi:hypothetical protein
MVKAAREMVDRIGTPIGKARCAADQKEKIE